MNLSVSIRNTATPAIKEAVAQIKGNGLVMAEAQGVRETLRDRFAELEQTRPNKMGFPRTHFWADVRGTVQVPQVQSPATATVSIAHQAIRQRVEGGKIVPTAGHEFLTLPEAPEAYGHRAREFSNLHFGFAENRYGNLAPALIENNATRVKFGRTRKDGTRKVTPGPEVGGAVFFWLVKQVYQPADPTILPSEARLQEAAIQKGDEWAQAMLDRAAAKRAEDDAKSGGAA